MVDGCRTVALFFAVVIAAWILSACNDGPVSGGSEKKTSLRYDLNAPIGILDPLTDQYSSSTTIYPFLYSHLFLPGEHGKIEPDLAVEWTHDTPNRTWNIRLRKDVLFHDGRPVTSRDVKYSIEQWAKVPVSRHIPIKAIGIITDTLLRIRLSQDDPDLPGKVQSLEIVPQGGALGATPYPVGSGPYKMTDRKTNGEIVLTANERYYFGTPSPYRIVFSYQPDKERSWARLLADKTDVVEEIYPKDFDMIKQYEGRFAFHTEVISYYSLILFNIEDPLLSDPEVRRALAGAVDVGRIIGEVLRNQAVPAKALSSIGLSPPGSADKPAPYDPRGSLERLRRLGWALDGTGKRLLRDGFPFELEFDHPERLANG